jgi:hypothetical protein
MGGIFRFWIPAWAGMAYNNALLAERAQNRKSFPKSKRFDPESLGSYTLPS